MSAREVEIVDISPRGEGGDDGRPDAPVDDRARWRQARWRPAGPWVWAGGLLLVGAVVFSLLTLRGTAWTSTTITDQGETVRTDLAGNSVVTVFDLPTQVVTTRLDGWGRTTTTTVVADSGNPGIGGSGIGPKYGLGFLFGAGAIGIAAALLAAGQYWSTLGRAARPASVAAAALLAGIWISGLIAVLGAHAQFVSTTTGGTVLDHHHFRLGNSVYLGLAGTVLAVAAAAVLNLLPRVGSDRPE